MQSSPRASEAGGRQSEERGRDETDASIPQGDAKEADEEYLEEESKPAVEDAEHSHTKQFKPSSSKWQQLSAEDSVEIYKKRPVMEGWCPTEPFLLSPLSYSLSRPGGCLPRIPLSRVRTSPGVGYPGTGLLGRPASRWWCGPPREG